MLSRSDLGFVTQPGSEEVLRSVATDSDGSFDFTIELPARDDSAARSVWGAGVLQLVGTSNGHGPAAIDMIGCTKR